MTAPVSENTRWLVRVPAVFHESLPEILADCGGARALSSGSEYFLTPACEREAICGGEAAKYIRWRLPVHHSWPCNPREMDGFVEKAAQALAGKFAPFGPQTLLAGPFDSGIANRYYKILSSNLRGRALQLFPPMPAAAAVEAQDPRKPTLFCLVGGEGLYCGISTPAAANGFHPGGSRFIRQDKDSISRAGAKLAEALHYLRLHRKPPPAGGHWLELGASPGGITAELLRHGYRVTAIDRAALDARLARAPGLNFLQADVAHFTPPAGIRFDAMACDVNGDARAAISHVTRLAAHLRPGALIIFTLKTPGVTGFEETNALCHAVCGVAENAGLRLVATTHLTCNRHEFTQFFERR
jgi:23S rRNA (cytidine2498-2'-O)-methyltransferase